MFLSIVATVNSTVVGWARTIGQAVKCLLRPPSSVATMACAAARDVIRSRSDLLAENALLRQQLIVLRRSVKRPRLHGDDRILMLILARVNRAWRDAMHLVKPDTVLQWHRNFYKNVWRRRSRPNGQPNRLAQDTVALIQRMAKHNVLWGAERVRGELFKLGIHVSKRTIQKYMSRIGPREKRGQTWGTFVTNHADDVWACDFLQLYDALFRPIFAFFIVKHGTREVVHFNVTRSPSDEWVAQQLREATPYCERPKYLIRDNDDKFGSKFTAVAEGTGIDIVRIPPKSPNLNPICERFLGGVRRECLDHVVILNADHLRRVLREYVATYFNSARPHQGLGQRIPAADGPMPNRDGGQRIVARLILGGLHHDYRRAA